MICPKCGADIGDSYAPDDYFSIRGGWYCEACEIAIGENEVPRKPVAGEAEIEPMAGDIEIMSAREYPGERPFVAPLANYRVLTGRARKF